MDGLDAGVVLLRASGDKVDVEYANPAFARITGFDPLIGVGCRLIGREDVSAEITEGLKRALATGIPYQTELGYPKQDGGQGWLHFSFSPVHDQAGPTTYLIGLAQDVTEARRSLARLEQSESELRDIMVSVEEGIQLWDAEGRLVYANPASSRLFHAQPGAPAWGEGQQFFRLDGSPVEPRDLPLHQALAGGQPVAATVFRAQGPDGKARWVRMQARPIRDPASGAMQGAVTSTVDLTQNMEQELYLTRLAHFDALTELPNRVLLADRMQQAIARAQRTREVFALGMLDLDGFKSVNDTYGHKAGDLVLREVAERVRLCIREGDTLARLGGDEFALLLAGLVNLPECERVLQRVLAAIAAPFMVEGNVVRLSASIGVTLYPNDPSEPDKLLRHADQAMYEAKEAGKNRIKYFDSGLERRNQANQGMVRKIALALEQGQFELYYQPVVDCWKGVVASAEALLRWRHPVLGLRLPAEFLPLVEHEDLIVTLGQWTMVEAVKQIRAWRQEGLDIDVSVNVSSRHLHQKTFIEHLNGLKHEFGAEAVGRLGMEIVETAALEDIGAVAQLAAQLKQAGVHISLDDFGTGYSSLVHLRRMPVDNLKIDQSFVGSMLADPLDLAIVEGVIGLAQAFHCRVVAEGVESIEHVLTLIELGCHHMQGYAIARPMPAAEFGNWLRAFRPDPAWQMAQSPQPLAERHDSHVCLAGINHRRWVDHLIASARGGAGKPHDMDYHACRFGQWYYGEGMRLYGQRDDFRRLEGLHRRVHDLGEELFAAACSAQEGAEQGDLVGALRASQKDLMAGLDGLLGMERESGGRTGPDDMEKSK